jgi:RNA polymerase sigma-70 factor, ECF subfamily
MSDPSDDELLASIVAGGDPAKNALEALMRRHRNGLLAFLIRRGASEGDAEDIVQEVFIRVYERAAQTFRGNSQVSSWLHTIAANLLHDSYRLTNRQQTLDEQGWNEVVETLTADPISEPAAVLDRRAFDDCVERNYAGFARKHPDMANALYYFVTLGWKSADLALSLGRTDAATRQYLLNCRRMLASHLRPCSDLAQAVLRG